MKTQAPGSTTKLLVFVAATLVIAPSVVSAGSESVVLKDADSKKKAQVEAGALRVGDGDGPLSIDGSVELSSPVDVSDGGESLTVDGRVLAQPGPQDRTLYCSGALVPDDNESPVVCQGLGSSHPNSRYLGVTSLTFANRGAEPVGVEVTPKVSNTACAPQSVTLNTFITSVVVPAGDTVHITFPHPYGVGGLTGEEDEFCLLAQRVHGPSGARVEIAMSGYWEE